MPKKSGAATSAESAVPPRTSPRRKLKTPARSRRTLDASDVGHGREEQSAAGSKDKQARVGGIESQDSWGDSDEDGNSDSDASSNARGGFGTSGRSPVASTSALAMQPGRKTRASVKNKKGNGKMAADAEDEGSELEQGGRKAAALPPMPDKVYRLPRYPDDSRAPNFFPNRRPCLLPCSNCRKSSGKSKQVVCCASKSNPSICMNCQAMKVTTCDFAVAKRSPADFIACPDGAMMRVGTNKKSRDVFWDHFGHLRNGSVWHASDYKKAGKCPGNAKKFLGYSDWLVAEDPIPVARAKRSRARSTDSAESYHDEEETPPARKKSKTAGKKTPSRKPVGRSSPVKRRTPAADPEAETFSIEVVSSASPSVKSATFHASAEQQPATRARTAEAPASPGSSREVAEPPTGNANPIAEEGADGLLRRLGLQDTNALWNWAVGTPIDIKRGGRG